MRKKFTSVLCAALLLTLSACGGSVQESSAEIQTEPVQTQAETAEPETEPITEAPTEPETEPITETPTEPETEEEAQLVTAAEVFAYLKENTPNIGASVEYDEETDVNNLLGRPNQYTSKINFEITTVEQIEGEDPKGGSIEVFANAEDAEARYAYIQEICKSLPFLAEYEYLNDYVLLRIDYAVTPSDEKQYEDALDAFMAE